MILEILATLSISTTNNADLNIIDNQLAPVAINQVFEPSKDNPKPNCRGKNSCTGGGSRIKQDKPVNRGDSRTGETGRKENKKCSDGKPPRKAKNCDSSKDFCPILCPDDEPPKHGTGSR